MLGGRGFVGSRVCQEALATGLHVVSISKSGVYCCSILRYCCAAALSSLVSQEALATGLHVVSIFKSGVGALSSPARSLARLPARLPACLPARNHHHPPTDHLSTLAGCVYAGGM